ncbi:hypothetical protein PYW08_009438 [Mythimna loreyi]|uniref:Uncharacterized protein n=1 Tax=Mythimna loreyi TaxID=667449 RepID=A0ACC2QAE1_9NEOP|nr:hypothetical protein PYW08_009438 [Mythimna loreyi]
MIGFRVIVEIFAVWVGSSNECYLILVIFTSRNKMAGWPCQEVATVFFILNSMAYMAAHQEMSSLSDLSDEAPAMRSYHSAEENNEPIQRRSDQYEGLPIEYNRRLLEKPKENVTTVLTTEATTTTTKRLVLDRRYRRIYNPDEVATIEEFPYMAALLVNNELWCGAVIIDKDKVLTAAHCLQLQYNNRFFREYVKMLTVRVGSTNATSGGELMRVSEIFFHPNYKPQTLEFNYAVLKIHKNMTFGRKDPAIEKINYAKDRVIPVDNHVMFLGWGSVLGIDGAGGQVLLQKVTLPVYDTSDCQEVYGRELVTRSNFCAGFITIPKNVCNHDAGGPAVMDGVLVGVLSFSSKRCDQADQPAVFSTVGAIADWLDQLGEKKNKHKTLMQ